MVTPTKIGLLHKLKQTYGGGPGYANWMGIDGDASTESAASTSPAAELTTGGCGRVQATVTDVSTASDIAMQLVSNWEFVAANSINAVFGAWAGTAGNNMTWRHKLTAVQNVGEEDTMSFTLIDHEGVAS